MNKIKETAVVLVGRKPVMNYVLATLTLFHGGAQRVIIKARGRAISRAVDIAEVTRRRFLTDLKIKSLAVGTELVAPRVEGGTPTNVSTIEIELELFIPLVQETIDFFQQAGFSTRRESIYHFMIKSQKRDFSRYGEIMVVIKTTGIVSGEDIRLLYKELQKTYGTDLRDRVTFLVVSSPPVGGALLQIMAYRWDLRLTIAPLSVQRIIDALKSKSCYDVANDTLRTYTGRADMYAISVPIVDPVMFFGREKLIDEMLDYIYHGQHIGLFSMRKMGKTSLLHQLKHGLSEKKGHPVAYLDLQGVSRNLASLLKSILKEFTMDIKYKYPDLRIPFSDRRLTGQDSIEVFKRRILKLHALVSKEVPEVEFVLILDEIDRLLPSKEYQGFQGYIDFLALIRGVFQQHRFLVSVISGVDPNINRFHDFPTFQFFKEIWLPPLEGEEVKKMIEELGGWMGVSYTKKSLEMIMEEGGCHPFITRMLCSSIYESLGKRTRVATKNVISGIEKFYQRHADYIESLWRDFLLPEEREVLRVLATQEKPLSRDSLSSKIRTLAHLDQLYLISTEKNSYAITSKLFQRWIRIRLKGENA